MPTVSSRFRGPSPGHVVSLQVRGGDPKVLQDFLASRLSLTRRAAKVAIDARSVWVNRSCVWMARYALEAGDVVDVPARAVRAGGGGPAAPRHVRVIWQDADYLVCDKPAGVLSGGDPKSAEAVLRAQEGLPALEAVHRLDRDTSGCLLFAKTPEARDAAVDVFRSRAVLKVYHAVVAGRFPYVHMTVDTPLDGRDAVTRVVREAVSDDASFLRLRIETGRTNQIRRHLASVRFPVVGDRVFGLKRARDPRLMQVPRQMLHASTLALPHPRLPHAEIKVHSPLPADFRATLCLFGMGPRARASSARRRGGCRAPS